MKNTLLPLIRLFSLSSKEFLENVYPFKKLLNPQLCDELLKSYLNPESEPGDNILLPRYIIIDGIVDSKIVNLNIVSIISRWVDKIDINNKYTYTRELYLPYKFKLLLRGSRDEFTPNKFHNLCDNIPHTVTFIKVKESDEVIGGYNPSIWKNSLNNSSEGWSKTKDSFIFSFKNKDYFKDSILSRVKNMDQALRFHHSCGPTFGSDLLINVKENNGSREYNSNQCKLQHYDKRIRATEDYFLIEDYEVFQIITMESLEMQNMKNQVRVESSTSDISLHRELSQIIQDVDKLNTTSKQFISSS